MARAKEGSESTPKRFKEILERLESLVERLESGDLSLEASLEAYEQGVKLAKAGAERLDEAERRLEVLGGDDETEPSSGGGAG